MGNFEIIKLTSDLLLVAAVCFLSFRILASGSLSGKTAQLMILEASLKGLIKDAEGTGRSLNDELQKRQYSLERLLSDLEGIEKRVAQMQNGFDQGRSQIDAQVLQAQHILSQITKIVGSQSAQMQSVARVEPLSKQIEVTPEPPSFEEAVIRPSEERHKLPERKQAPLSRAAAARQEVLQKQKLVTHIEREVEASIAPNPQRVVENTAAAVEDVAKDIRRMTEQPDSEGPRIHRETRDTPEADPRLGVLGGMKRVTQTL